MKTSRIALALGLSAALVMGCENNGGSSFPSPTTTPTTFQEVGQITLGGGNEGAAEISTFDPDTERLFVVNNSASTAVDVVDLSDPASPSFITSLDMTTYGGGVNSVAVSNGMLAVANENDNKQAPGVIAFFNTSDYAEVATVTVGALPDMVTFTPDGAYAIVANEGEPDDDYLVDPEGSISIIDMNSFAATTLGFTSFNADEADLEEDGFRVFGPNATLAQDVEPEYVAVSDDSQTAYVTLQENNGVAIVNIATATITSIVPLGVKDWNTPDLPIDVSDEDNEINPAGSRPVVGMYQPDAIAFFRINGIPFVITANEGDARDYDGYSEEERVDDLTLDAGAYPAAATLQMEENLGRMKVTTANGDTDGDNDYDLIWTYGARSFSIWSGFDGSLVYDSGTDTEDQAIAAGVYPDSRSDDKGTEPEGVVVGVIANTTYAFIGLERADAVLVYDISNPTFPIFKQLLNTGDAPEGLLWVDGADSPNGEPMLIVSSEDDGSVQIFQLQ